MKYAAICATVKDEDVYLKEWLAYHTSIGFEHFILYDNCSERPVEDLLKGFADASMVTIYRHKREKGQKYSYNHCIKTFRHDVKWIAFIDADEFINLQCSDDIKVFLGEYEQYAGVGLTWRMFSSNGHTTTPLQPVIQAYTRYLKDDSHIKSIVQPALTKTMHTPHTFTYLKNYYCVDTHRMPIPNGIPFTLPQTDLAYINHYYYKSRESFAAKLARGNPANIQRKMDEFEHHLKEKTKKDLCMLHHLNAVTAILEKGITTPQLPYNADELAKEHDIGYLLSLEAEKFLKNNETHLARLFLCYASMFLKNGDLIKESRIWSLRAKAALLESRFDDAKIHAEHALTLADNLGAYAIFLELFKKQKNVDDAKKLLALLRLREHYYQENKSFLPD